MEQIDDDQFFIRLADQSMTDSVAIDGKFRVLHEIARGGQGVVFKAIDTRTNEFYALKKSHGVSDGTDTKLSRGAELSQLLDHPFILPIVETKSGFNAFWIVMPWVDGVPLDLWCKDQGADVEVKLSQFFRVCDAIMHAHGRGVIHRDIRPANILVSEDGDPCVLDFGMAKRVELAGFAHSTSTSDSCGDICFLAPEMLGEDRPVANIGQDVYSLGVLLYTMLTGGHPFDGLPLNECISKAVSSGIFSSDIDHELPRSLGPIIRKATSMDLNARYNNVWELIQDVQDDANGFPIRARVHTGRYLCSRFIMRHRASLVAACLSSVVMLFGSVLLGRAIEKEHSNRAAKIQIFQLFTSLLDSLVPGGDVGPNGTGLNVLNYVSDQIQSTSAGNTREEMLLNADTHLAIACGYTAIRQASIGVVHAEISYRIYQELLGEDDDKTLEAGGLYVHALFFSEGMKPALDMLESMHDDLSPGAIRDSQQLLNMAVISERISPEGAADPYYKEYFSRTEKGTESRALALEQRSAYLNRSGLPQQAFVDIQGSYQIRRDLFGPNDSATLTSQLFMAKSLQLLGRFDQVYDLLEKIMPSVEHAFGPHDYRTLRGRAHMCIASVELGFPGRGYQSATNILAINQEHHPHDSFRVVQSKFLVAHALLGLGRPAEVISLLEKDIEVVESLVNGRPRMKYMPRYWVARAYNDLGEYETASRLIQVGIQGLGATLGPDNRQTLLCKYEQLRALTGMGMNGDLKDNAADQLEASFVQWFGEDHPATERVRAFAFTQ